MIAKMAQLEAENKALRTALAAIERKYDAVMKDPPEWVSFSRRELMLIREAWYGASLIARAALVSRLAQPERNDCAE